MKRFLLSLALGASLISPVSSWAESVYGKVTFIGTIGEYHNANEGYHAQLRFRVSDSTCTNANTPKERWIMIRSGRMDDKFVHNEANFRNAFSLLMAAFLSGKGVQIDGLPNCNDHNTINLWSSQIGMY